MATKNVVGHLVYKVTGDSKELDQSLKKSQSQAAKFSKFMLSALGIGGAVIALRTLLRVGKDLVAAYGVQEQAENRLAAAIRATGGDVEDLMAQYTTFASEIQTVTTVGDEQVLGLIQIGESLGITRDKMQEATRGAIGLSRAFGIDMNTAMRGIALAYEGNYTQLSRYIPALRTAGDEAERQAILQEAMANGFAIAKAEAETGTGAMLQLQNAIGDLKEQGGAMIVDFLKPSIKSLTEFVTNTTAAIAESRRLKKVAEELAEGKKVEAADEIALLQARIKGLESQRQLVKGYKESEAGIDAQIAAIRRQISALSEVARWEAIGAAAKREGDAQALADAEAQAQRQRELAAWIQRVNEAYGRTPEAQRAILDSEIAFYEYWLPRSEVYKGQIEAILKLLYQQRDAGQEVTDTWKERLAAMIAETDAAIEQYQLELDAFAAMREEMSRIEAERLAERKRQEDEYAEHVRMIEQSLMDFMVSIWGQLDAAFQARLRGQLAALDLRYRTELENFEGTEEEKVALEEEYERKRAQLEYDAALTSWKLQMVGAYAAAARAVLEAAKNAWPIPALPLMALAGIMGAVQIAAIHNAKPVPAFATGADFVVPPGYPNDSFPMRVESGEHVVVEPAGTASTDMLHVTINLDGKQIAAFVTEAARRREIRVAQRAIVS